MVYRVGLRRIPKTGWLVRYIYKGLERGGMGSWVGSHIG